MPAWVFRLHPELWIAFVLAAFALAPVARHVTRGWAIKRDDIFSSLSTEAKRLYLDTFLSLSAHEDPAAAFEKLYKARFGRWNYILPVLFFSAVLVPLCYLLGVTALTQVNVLSAGSKAGLFDLLTATTPYVSLPAIASAGIMGAYLWIVAELITSEQKLDLPPGDIMRATLRLLVSAPLGYAIGSLATHDVAPFVAFAVGAFPLDQIGVMLRKLANRQLKLDADAGGQQGQVSLLEGVDGLTAERLREAGVTTVAQLAYFDPVQLSMRTGLAFDFILDLVGQALAWIYFGAKLDLLRPAGLRGSIEIANLYNTRVKGTPGDAAKAEKIIAAAAALVKLDESLLMNACDEIAGDPANEFLIEVWDCNNAPAPAETRKFRHRKHHRQTDDDGRD